MTLPRRSGHRSSPIRRDAIPDSGKTPSEATGGDARRLDFRPGMEMWWEITRGTADTSGELFEAINWIGPGMAGPPVHVHPTATESYAVVEGEIEVFLDGRWSPLRPGETARVPAGAPHSVRNASAERAKIVNVHQPAQRFEAFFTDLQRLIGEGRIRRLPPKDPRSAIYAAMLFARYPEEIRTTKPPYAVFAALALLGRALRFKV